VDKCPNHNVSVLQRGKFLDKCFKTCGVQVLMKKRLPLAKTKKRRPKKIANITGKTTGKHPSILHFMWTVPKIPAGKKKTVKPF
jgi:hypothetical protein